MSMAEWSTITPRHPTFLETDYRSRGTTSLSPRHHHSLHHKSNGLCFIGIHYLGVLQDLKRVN